MKKLIFIVLIIFLSVATVYADRWCQWDGSEAINCQSDSKGYILVNDFPTRTPTIAHSNGWYRLVVTEPTISANQIKDSEVYTLDSNIIEKTWSVRDLTQDEIDTRDGRPMSLNTYYLWKTLLTTGIITQQQAQNNLPQELIDAYAARNRLEQ